MELALPFLDRDLVGFLMAVPGEYTSFGGVPRAILREAMRGVIPDTVVERRWKRTSAIGLWKLWTRT